MRRGSAERSTALTYKLYYALRHARRVDPRYVGAATAMGCIDICAHRRRAATCTNTSPPPQRATRDDAARRMECRLPNGHMT